VFTALEANQANELVSKYANAGSVVYQGSGTPGTFTELAVGTAAQVLKVNAGATAPEWGAVVNANIDASAAIALSKLATGALPTAITVASANLVDGTIVLADLAASLQAYLCPVGTINAYAGATAPTGWLLCNGTSTTGYAALAALVGATTPDMRGLFPIGKTASSTGSTLLGTGGSTTITTANLPSHSHANTPALSSGTVSVTDPGHTHTITDPGHGHTINDHTHTNQVTYISPAASHAHNNISDYVAAGTNGASTSPTVNSISTTSLAANSNTTGISTVSAGTGISASVGTAITANNASTGSGTAYFQPFIAVNYIIKHD
jgi:microcystin-dependent protein